MTIISPDLDPQEFLLGISSLTLGNDANSESSLTITTIVREGFTDQTPSWQAQAISRTNRSTLDSWRLQTSEEDNQIIKSMVIKCT